MAWLIAHKDALLSSLLAVSEVIGLWVGKGGIVVTIVNALKALGAKEPGA